jgi:hypothetical protein
MNSLRCAGRLLPYTEVASEAKKPTRQSAHLMLERSAGCIGYANHFDEDTEPAISHFAVQRIVSGKACPKMMTSALSPAFVSNRL